MKGEDPAAWEHQRRTFDRTAEAYDRYRPSYPVELFDDVRAYADLAPDDRILEVGTGTGRGTIRFAEWGNPILAIESAPAMAEVARRNLSSFPHVEIRTARFEDADIDDGSFGLATCTQAWHWLDEATRIRRFADALYAHGTAAIIGNVQVVPDDNRAFWERAQDVYRKHTPGMEHQGDFRKPDDLPPHPLEGSELFADLRQIGHAWHWTLPTEDYLELCATHSNKAALEPAVREQLLAGLGELIDAEFGGHVTEHYVALAGLAKKR